MEQTRILLAGVWIVVMLIYLLGDVLRIYYGDFTPGEVEGQPISQAMWFGVAVFMLIPILMIFLSMTLARPAIRWANIIVAIIFFIFNLSSLRSYPSAYDRFLLAVSLVFNVVTVWYAWNWD